jgi:hypothetical protein
MVVQDWLAIVGSLASIIGVVVSLYVLQAVRRIRHRYIRQAMMEACLARLHRCRTNLRDSAESRDADQFRQTLGTLKAILRRIDLHKQSDRTVQWSDEEIDALIQLDNRRIVARSRQIVARLNDWIETIDLELTATRWGNDED